MPVVDGNLPSFGGIMACWGYKLLLERNKEMRFVILFSRTHTVPCLLYDGFLMGYRKCGEKIGYFFLFCGGF